MHQDGQEILVSLLPEEGVGLQFLNWKLVLLQHLIILDLVIIRYLVIDNLEALLKHLNLSVQLVHFVFIFKHHVLVHISNFEFEVL